MLDRLDVDVLSPCSLSIATRLRKLGRSAKLGFGWFCGGRAHISASRPQLFACLASALGYVISIIPGCCHTSIIDIIHLHRSLIQAGLALKLIISRQRNAARHWHASCIMGAPCTLLSTPGPVGLCDSPATRGQGSICCGCKVKSAPGISLTAYFNGSFSRSKQ